MTRLETLPAKPDVAVILAAGEGSRLYRGAGVPKPLAPLLGLSLAERVVCAFLKDLGVRRFLVVVGHEAETVKSHFRDIARRRGATVEFAEAENWRLGNGASALAAKGRCGDRPFYLSMCDHIFDPRIGELLARHPPADGGICLAVDKDREGLFDPEDATRVSLDGGHIVEIGKTLEDWQATDTGLFVCTPGLFEGLERAAARGQHGLSDGVRELARAGRALAVDATGLAWLDVDTPEALAEAESRMLAAERGKAGDGPVARYLNRPVSRLMTRYLIRWPLTPNRISIAAWLLSCLAAVLFALGGYPALALGGAIAQLGSIVDGCDGEVARLKRMESQFGGWFDAVLDRYADAFLLFGLTWHVWAAEPAPLVLAVGFAAIIGSFMNSYTADKYDGLMARRIARGSPVRLGRDVRVFVIFLGAVANLPFATLAVVAAVMNGEVIRRVLVCRGAEES
jgi:CDP-L-myo-inositol myo-inositolphosphotransferase